MCVRNHERCPQCEQPLDGHPHLYRCSAVESGQCRGVIDQHLFARPSRYYYIMCHTEGCFFNPEHNAAMDREYFAALDELQPGLSAAATASNNRLETTAARINSTNTFTAINRPVIANPIVSRPSLPSNGIEPTATPGSQAIGTSTPQSTPSPFIINPYANSPAMRHGNTPRSRIRFTQPSRGGRLKTQFRATGTVTLASLDQDVVDEIERLMQRMKERIEVQEAYHAIAIPWLLEEDTLLQLLRLQGFGFGQIAKDFLHRRSRASCQFRRTHQHEKHAPGFQYVSDDLPTPTDDSLTIAQTPDNSSAQTPENLPTFGFGNAENSLISDTAPVENAPVQTLAATPIIATTAPVHLPAINNTTEYTSGYSGNPSEIQPPATRTRSSLRNMEIHPAYQAQINNTGDTPATSTDDAKPSVGKGKGKGKEKANSTTHAAGVSPVVDENVRPVTVLNAKKTKEGDNGDTTTTTIQGFSNVNDENVRPTGGRGKRKAADQAEGDDQETPSRPPSGWRASKKRRA